MSIQRSIVVMALVAGVAGIVVAGGGFSPPYVVGAMSFMAAFFVGHIARESGWDDAGRYEASLDKVEQIGRLGPADLRALSGDECNLLGRVAHDLAAQADLIRALLKRIDYDSSSYSMGATFRESPQTDLERVLARARAGISASAEALRPPENTETPTVVSK